MEILDSKRFCNFFEYSIVISSLQIEKSLEHHFCQSFQRKMPLLFNIKPTQIEGQDLEITLNNSNASYHHSCKNAYDNRMYKRQLEKNKGSPNLESKYILKSPPTIRWLLTVSNEVISDKGICCCCKCIDKRENVHIVRLTI